MDWNDVRHFLALARLGSVRAAGASLGVSHSTVARRVETLEAQLSVRLFDRNRDGYTLTEAGEEMVPGAERIEAEFLSLERGLLGQDARLEGRVSVTCCDSFVSGLLMPELARFCEEYPGIELGLTNDSRPFDLSRREADIAIRILGRQSQPPEYLVGKRVVPLVMASYVGRAHAARLDPGLGGQGRWVAYDERDAMQPAIQASSHADLPLWGSFSSLEVGAQATAAGLGIGLLPTYVGDPHPGLQRLQDADPRHLADLWLLSHPDLRRNARFRVTRARLARALERLAPLFAGACPADGTGRPEIAPDGCVAGVVPVSNPDQET